MSCARCLSVLIIKTNTLHPARWLLFNLIKIEKFNFKCFSSRVIVIEHCTARNAKCEDFLAVKKQPCEYQSDVSCAWCLNVLKIRTNTLHPASRWPFQFFSTMFSSRVIVIECRTKRTASAFQYFQVAKTKSVNHVKIICHAHDAWKFWKSEQIRCIPPVCGFFNLKVVCFHHVWLWLSIVPHKTHSFGI